MKFFEYKITSTVIVKGQMIKINSKINQNLKNNVIGVLDFLKETDVDKKVTLTKNRRDKESWTTRSQVLADVGCDLWIMGNHDGEEWKKIERNGSI